MTVTAQRSRPGLMHRVGWLLVLLTFGGAWLPLLSAPSAHASNTICVALVVDFSPLGGNVDSGCTRVPSGATGYDVLHAGGHTFEVCSNGVIGTIDGRPRNGCQIKDDTHFWGYWHRKPGSSTWTFSNYGAAIYHPGEGSTEGWVWENGTTKPPADVPYPAGCHSPPSSPSPAASRPSSTSTATAAPATTSHGSGVTGTATTSTTAGQVRSGRRHPHRRAEAAPSGTPRDTATATPATTPGATVPASVMPGGVAADPPATATAGGTTALPVLGGVGVAALLGAGSWWRFRRAGAS